MYVSSADRSCLGPAARHPEELSAYSIGLCNAIRCSVVRCSQPDGIVTGMLLGQVTSIGMSQSQVERREGSPCWQHCASPRHFGYYDQLVVLPGMILGMIVVLGHLLIESLSEHDISSMS